MKLSKLLKQLRNLVLTLLVLLGHYIINSQISLKVIIFENVWYFMYNKKTHSRTLSINFSCKKVKLKIIALS